MESSDSVPDLLHRLEQMKFNLEHRLALPDVDWSWRSDVNEWSLTEVICHLRDVEKEVHQRRFKDLIGRDNVFIPGVSADEWAEIRKYRDQDGPTTLNEFLTYRQETLDILAELDTDVWNRQGRHAYLGLTSMSELLQIAVRHDEIHWDQINRLINKKKG